MKSKYDEETQREYDSYLKRINEAKNNEEMYDILWEIGDIHGKGC